MRVARLALSFFLILSSSLCLRSQQSVATPQRDPQAMSILQTAIARAGGAQAIRAIRDFAASGQITYFQEDGPVTGTVEITARGRGQLRIVSHLQDGERTMLINHGKGRMSGPNLNLDISSMNAFHLGLSILPLLDLVAVSDDPLASVSFEGIEQVGGLTLYKIRLINGTPPQLLQMEGLKNLKGAEVLVNTADYAVVLYRHSYFIGNSTSRSIPREVEFYDFRSVNNVLVPFKMSERFGVQTRCVITLQNVEFNTGVTDQTFSLSPVQP